MICRADGWLSLCFPLDFEKTFIQCIVYNYDVLKELGDEGAVKSAGKVLTKGKDYVGKCTVLRPPTATPPLTPVRRD